MTSGARACEVTLAGAELLSEARALASAEVRDNVKVSLVIIFASSELSSVQRGSKMASEISLPVTVVAVVVPFPEGLSLVADVSTEVMIATMDLKGVIFVRALVSVAGSRVSVILVSASEMVLAGIKVLSEDWVPRG